VKFKYGGKYMEQNILCYKVLMEDVNEDFYISDIETVPETPPEIYPAKIEVFRTERGLRELYYGWFDEGGRWVLVPIFADDSNNFVRICPRKEVSEIMFTVYTKNNMFKVKIPVGHEKPPAHREISNLHVDVLGVTKDTKYNIYYVNLGIKFSSNYTGKGTLFVVSDLGETFRKVINVRKGVNDLVFKYQIGTAAGKIIGGTTVRVVIVPKVINTFYTPPGTCSTIVHISVKSPHYIGRLIANKGFVSFYSNYNGEAEYSVNGKKK